jgi:hypothetical protein
VFPEGMEDGSFDGTPFLMSNAWLQDSKLYQVFRNVWLMFCYQEVFKTFITLCTTSYSKTSNVILACVFAGIVVDLFYEGKVLP